MNKVIPFTLISLPVIMTCSSQSGTQKPHSGLPNIVIFLADDQGYGDFSITGNTNLKTPNIDKLAAEGTMLTRFYVCPVSSPTRSELLTGRYHLRSGVTETSEGYERTNLDETTIADIFKRAGYATAAFGKWHNGMQYPYHPNGRGFDEFYGFCSGHWSDYFSPMLEHNGQLVRGEGYTADDFTGKAMAFIEENLNKPFFLYIPYNTPHSPMQVPDEYWDRFKDKELLLRGTQPNSENIRHTRAALAMCENIDWNVGRVLDMLKKKRLEKNTIVLYFNDNGPNGNRWRDGMKGQKASTDEGGVRSPLFIKWPGVIPEGKTISQICGVIDLLPTLADLAGIEAETANPPDGISIKPLILNGMMNNNERVIYSHFKNRISLRTQQYRYMHTGELYDMIADPGQTKDIASEKPELAQKFKIMIEEWKADVTRNLSSAKLPFTVGHPDFKYTQLPARDGDPHGEIVRSNKFPNSSYFTNWQSVNDKITWPIQVIEDGVFEVEIYYTCPRGQEGSEIKLSFGNNSLVTRITESHDPPLFGMQNDRLERSESYDKDFRPLKAGTIFLNKDTGYLTLEAVNIPGSQVMDFRMLLLKRIK